LLVLCSDLCKISNTHTRPRASRDVRRRPRRQMLQAQHSVHIVEALLMRQVATLCFVSQPNAWRFHQNWETYYSFRRTKFSRVQVGSSPFALAQLSRSSSLSNALARKKSVRPSNFVARAERSGWLGWVLFVTVVFCTASAAPKTAGRRGRETFIFLSLGKTEGCTLYCLRLYVAS
jgi:hypothetical protein